MRVLSHTVLLFCALRYTDAADAWLDKFGVTASDLSFSGVNSFGHLRHAKCLADPNQQFDVALLGFPFDTSVSYRPGARFGPHAIRMGSRRQRPERGFSLFQQVNPYEMLNVLDCDDAPISPYDNQLAFDMMDAAYESIYNRRVHNSSLRATSHLSKTGKEHPRVISMGGDHSIVLPALRALYKIYGEIAVIHFDAHLDTWDPAFYPGSLTPLAEITHGSFFHIAHKEGLIDKTGSIHVGIRTRIAGTQDMEHDARVGFQTITTDDIDDIGVAGIIEKVRARVGTKPVYLSFDIDTIDPGLAPGTGTPESGGFTSREAKRIIRGLAGLNLIGADVVEVSPAYDHAETTGIAAADLIFEFLGLFAQGPSVQSSKVNQAKDEL